MSISTIGGEGEEAEEGFLVYDQEAYSRSLRSQEELDRLSRVISLDSIGDAKQCLFLCKSNRVFDLPSFSHL